MATDDVLHLADRNMLETWIGLAAAAGGTRRDEDGVVLLSSGLPIAMFNPAFVVGPLGDHGLALDAVRAHYRELGLPFALYFRDATAPGLADVCAATGMVEHWQAPLMVLDPIPAAADDDTADGFAVEPVTAATYDEYLRTLCDGFGMPYDLMAPALGPAMLDIPGFTGLLGRTADGTAVAASAVCVTGTTAGIYNVATIPDHRGHGYGAAITAAAARHGVDTAGCTHAILQASEAGEPVYRRMGYATPDRYRQFEG